MRTRKHITARAALHLSALVFALMLAATTASSQDAQLASVEQGRDPEAIARVNPHADAVQERCAYCHKKNSQELNRDPVSTCTKCHQANVGNHPVTRHPIGKKTRIPIPAVLPVTEDDSMVCYTCHEPHGRTQHKRMLRTSYHNLCVQCHRGY